MVHALPPVVLLAALATANHHWRPPTPRANHPSREEVVVFATGWNGPIDNGDDWRYFDFSRATTVISLGGGVPSGLLTKAHAARPGVRVIKALVLDVDVAGSKADLDSWLSTAAGWVTGPNGGGGATPTGIDGINVVAIRHQSPSVTPSDLAAVFKRMRALLPSSSQLSATLPLTTRNSNTTAAGSAGGGTSAITALAAALAAVTDFVVLAAYDLHLGERYPAPNVGLDELEVGIAQLTGAGIAAARLVVALPWHGWDYRCGLAAAHSMGSRPGPTGSGSGCTVAPPAGSLATWHGWNVQRSAAYVAELTGTVAGPATLPPSRLQPPPALDPASQTMSFGYVDITGAQHVVMYDSDETLARKYAACRAAGLRGVGVWTADMVSYIGGTGQANFAAAMWKSLDTPTAAARSVVPDEPTAASPAAPAKAAHGASPAHIQRLNNRLRRRLGLPASALIPGYNPCKQRPAPPSTGKGCSQGLICLSPLPNGPAEHESGGCYPVAPSMSFVASILVPPIPPTFRPEEATVYYYLNLVMPDDGNSDVTNSTKGYGFMNQFVPQLELGEALCGSTGAPGGYQTGSCDIVDPLRHWVIQSQYFFGVLNHSGVPDPSGVSWTGHAVTGETIPVFPGETVITNFTLTPNGTWLLQFSVDESDPGAVIRGRGNTVSTVRVDHPYMNPKFSWLHDDFNHTLVGACNEVYNLQPRRGDIARPLDMNITVADPRKGVSLDWMTDWRINEGLPQCPTGLGTIDLTTSYDKEAGSQTARLYAT